MNDASKRRMNGLFTVVTMLLMAGIIVTIAGCGGSGALVGKWEETSDGEIMEFFKNGTVNIDGEECTWKAEKGRLTITISYLGMTDSVTVGYKVSGSKLTVTEDDGEVYTYKKIK